MTRSRRASVIAALSVIAWAATASAECAGDMGASIVDPPVRDSIGSVDLP